jgi:hypothetical protein
VSRRNLSVLPVLVALCTLAAPAAARNVGFHHRVQDGADAVTVTSSLTIPEGAGTASDGLSYDNVAATGRVRLSNAKGLVMTLRVVRGAYARHSTEGGLFSDYALDLEVVSSHDPRCKAKQGKHRRKGVLVYSQGDGTLTVSVKGCPKLTIDVPATALGTGAVLTNEPPPPTPDKIHLTFNGTTSDNASRYYFPKGTALSVVAFANSPLDGTGWLLRLHREGVGGVADWSCSAGARCPVPVDVTSDKAGDESIVASIGPASGSSLGYVRAYLFIEYCDGAPLSPTGPCP